MFVWGCLFAHAIFWPDGDTALMRDVVSQSIDVGCTQGSMVCNKGTWCICQQKHGLFVKTFEILFSLFSFYY